MSQKVAVGITDKEGRTIVTADKQNQLAKVDFSNTRQLDAVNELLKIVDSGEVDLQEFTAQKKRHAIMKKFFDHKEIKDWQLEQANLYGKDERTFHGMEVSIANTGKTDYEACADPLWERLDALVKEFTKQRKEREKFLQTIPDGKTMHVAIETMPETVSVDYGELVEISWPVKSSTQTLKFSEVKRAKV